MYLGLCTSIAWFTVSPHTTGTLKVPRGLGKGVQNISFNSADGTKLSGWLAIPPTKLRGAIVLCHGVGGNRRSMSDQAVTLFKHGYAVLLFDFRAAGNSDGYHGTLGYRETEDLLAAVALLKKEPSFSGKGIKIGVAGHSMGGAVALMATARCTDIQAVEAESAFSELDHAVDNHFKIFFGGGSWVFEGTSCFIGERIIGKNCRDISPVSEVSKIGKRAVYLIADLDDKLCPLAETQAIKDACVGPVSLWKVPNAGHIQASDIRPKEFDSRMLSFFDHSLKRSAIRGSIKASL